MRALRERPRVIVATAVLALAALAAAAAAGALLADDHDSRPTTHTAQEPARDAGQAGVRLRAVQSDLRRAERRVDALTRRVRASRRRAGALSRRLRRARPNARRDGPSPTERARRDRRGRSGRP